MIMKPLLIIFFALACCGSAPKKPAQPEEQPNAQETQPSADSSESLPVDSRKYKIVKAAKDEWVYFDQQKVVSISVEKYPPNSVE